MPRPRRRHGSSFERNYAFLRTFPVRSRVINMGNPFVMTFAIGFPMLITRWFPGSPPVTPGDLFVGLTDGLTEVNDRAQVEFGMNGVVRTLEHHAASPLPTDYNELLTAARSHGPQTDDQTLLLVRAR